MGAFDSRRRLRRLPGHLGIGPVGPARVPARNRQLLDIGSHSTHSIAQSPGTGPRALCPAAPA